jgi:hypothetical protein
MTPYAMSPVLNRRRPPRNVNGRGGTGSSGAGPAAFPGPGLVAMAGKSAMSDTVADGRRLRTSRWAARRRRWQRTSRWAARRRAAGRAAGEPAGEPPPAMAAGEPLGGAYDERPSSIDRWAAQTTKNALASRRMSRWAVETTKQSPVIPPPSSLAPLSGASMLGSQPPRAAASVPAAFDPLGGSTVRPAWQMTRPAGEQTPGRPES